MKRSDLNALLVSSVFADLSETEVTAIVKDNALETVIYKKHEAIFTPGEYTRSLAVILKGSADVYKETDKGPLFLSILGVGAVFGMAAMFYEKNGFINTVRAREDCRVLFITKQQLVDIFRKYPAVSENYITVLSERIHYLNAKLSVLTAASPSGRLLNWLTAEGERQKKNEFTLSVSYSELALILSLGRTSLYRSFDELEEQGKVLRSGKTITLINDRSQETLI